MRFFWGAVSAPEILLFDALIAFRAVRGSVNCSEGNREWIKTPEGNWIEEEGSESSADCGVYVILNQQYVPFHEYLVLSSFEVFFWFLGTLVQYIQIVVILLYPSLGYAFKRYSHSPQAQSSDLCVVESEVSTRTPNQHQWIGERLHNTSGHDGVTEDQEACKNLLRSTVHASNMFTWLVRHQYHSKLEEKSSVDNIFNVNKKKVK